MRTDFSKTNLDLKSVRAFHLQNVLTWRIVLLGILLSLLLGGSFFIINHYKRYILNSSIVADCLSSAINFISQHKIHIHQKSAKQRPLTLYGDNLNQQIHFEFYTALPNMQMNVLDADQVMVENFHSIDLATQLAQNIQQQGKQAPLAAGAPSAKSSVKSSSTRSATSSATRSAKSSSASSVKSSSASSVNNGAGLHSMIKRKAIPPAVAKAQGVGEGIAQKKDISHAGVKKKKNAYANSYTVVKAEELEQELFKELNQQYIIQLGIFKTKPIAQHYRNKLALKELNIVKINVGKELAYRVQQGPFLNQRQAKIAHEKLRKRGISGMICRA